MKKSIYKKNVSGYLNVDLEPIYKEVECVSTNIFDVDNPNATLCFLPHNAFCIP